MTGSIDLDAVKAGLAAGTGGHDVAHESPDIEARCLRARSSGLQTISSLTPTMSSTWFSSVTGT